MIRNYLKIAFRNLQRNKIYSAINIGGLAIGMATCLLITLYVLDEISYDRYHQKADRIYRIDFDVKFGGQDREFATVSDGMGDALKNDYPFIETFTRFRPIDILVKKGNQSIRESMSMFVDNSVFEVFDIPLIEGDAKTALQEPFTIVLDEQTAQKYFGKTQVLGITMTIDEKAYKVTGVMKKIPENSHFRGRNMFLSMASSADSRANNWLNNNFFTYLVFKEGTKPEQLKSQFDKVIHKYMMPQFKSVMGIKSIEELEKAGNRVALGLTSLTDIHLHSNKFYELSPNSSIQYVYIFSAIALFILLIACVNFMNLSTARSVNRAKEVGVRKVMGSVRTMLMNQFLSESILMSLIAFILALGIATLVLPFFNDISAKNLNLSFVKKPLLLSILFSFAVFVGLLAGIYPALFLSSFKPISILKGKLSATTKGGYFRSSLVVFQFFASIFLIISTIVIYCQLDFIQKQNIGFNREQVIVINDTNLLEKGLESFKNELLQISGIKSATISAFLPTPSYRNNTVFWTEGQLSADNGITMQFWEVGYDYTETLKMQFVAGRDFDKTMSTDSLAIIINETTAKQTGYKNPIGQKLYAYGGNLKDLIPYTIIGVVKNFNYASLRENVASLSMCLAKKPYGMISVRVQSDDFKQSIAQIEEKWKARAGGTPLNYQFLDEAFDNMYRTEQRIGKVFISFAVLAILIACLGLFGLATFTAEQRTKEIGVRKVLGASIWSIVQLLSKDFLKLVCLAFVIASPLAYYAMSTWLKNFAFRTDIPLWVFIGSGTSALAITLLTVSYQSIKTALMNPVKSLKTE
ncbi:FtsX-like permease family protein [Runella sp. CRIBMP]|uniref:ABC transporter permease n=1 Tax=Runella sp. CRIBMP TaxID=2683261 RepID=UPI0014120A43|nr:ABC transporter permease [Runella sp. CRIBMP]NBB19927.1 FtsX-like permease family protein [Runella sp. CRIBMP]